MLSRVLMKTEKLFREEFKPVALGKRHFQPLTSILVGFYMLFCLANSCGMVLCIQDGRCLSLDVGKYSSLWHVHHESDSVLLVDENESSIHKHHQDIPVLVAAVLGKSRIVAPAMFQNSASAIVAAIDRPDQCSPHFTFPQLKLINLLPPLLSFLDTVKLLL